MYQPISSLVMPLVRNSPVMRPSYIVMMRSDRRNTSSRSAELLHQYGPYIIGRMGVPYRERGVNIISVALDAPNDVISALSGKLGRLDGITAKTVYAPDAAIRKEVAK